MNIYALEIEKELEYLRKGKTYLELNFHATASFVPVALIPDGMVMLKQSFMSAIYVFE